MTLRPVILAGGSGTRLWPLSRDHYPKQFLALTSSKTMFQETLLRLDGIDGLEEPMVVCNEVHRFLVLDQMRELNVVPTTIIVEPVGRNTAPALTLAALRLAETDGEAGVDPVLLSSHSDHLVRDKKAFQSAVSEGVELAESGYMVTFGARPTSPETGMGYIRRGGTLGAGARNGAYVVDSFVEKPDLVTAESYLDSDDYYWNTGIFMMRASVWLSEINRYRPAIAKACASAYSNGQVDRDFYRPGAAEFIACPTDSIDYAVMENATRGDRRSGGSDSPAECAVVPIDAGWSDVGAWSSLWEEREQDGQGNVIEGDVLAESTRNALLLAQSRLLAAVGLEDVVVVETADAVLVVHKDKVQDVKQIVDRLRAAGRSEHESHRKVHRPWGTYEIVDSGDGFQVKRLTINPGSALSLQLHRQRAEHWVVVNGTAKVVKDNEEFTLEENESMYVPIGATHRLQNPGDVPLEIIEVQTGAYLGEDDIVRLQDDYDRHLDA